MSTITKGRVSGAQTKNLAESAIDGRNPSLSADSNPLHNPH